MRKLPAVSPRSARVICTWFGSGLSPKMPGTMGSIAALPLALLAQIWGGNALLLIVAVLVYALGVYACRTYLDVYGGDDPSEVVIDEVAGQCLLLAALAPSWEAYVLGLILFRFFDIVKPWPVSWADRRIKGPTGVMLDDILAALYGIALLAVLSHFVSIPGIELVRP